MTSQSWPAMLPVRSVRIARPTDKLDEVVRFYRAGLGLPELDRFAGHAGYRGVLLGLPGTQYHLEFTQHDDGSPGLAPSRDNLIVLYFDDLTQVEQVAARLAALGYLRVEAENPYWTDNGAVTIEDPDHWRVVLLSQRAPAIERKLNLCSVTRSREVTLDRAEAEPGRPRVARDRRLCAPTGRLVDCRYGNRSAVLPIRGHLISVG